MARFRLVQPAQNDLANILATSAERWGTEGRRRYARLLAAAKRVVAANPEGPPKVKKPVQVLYHRALQPGLIEIVRVLHERMEPSRHFDDQT